MAGAMGVMRVALSVNPMGDKMAARKVLPWDKHSDTMMVECSAL